MMALRFKLSRVVFRRLLVPRVLFECCFACCLCLLFVFQQEVQEEEGGGGLPSGKS